MLLIALIMIGGIKRIGKVTEKLIPFMALLYIILAIGVIIVNITNVPYVFKSIFQGAFSPASVTGGAVGSFFMSMKKVYQEVYFLMKPVWVQVLLRTHVQIQENL